MLRTRPNRYRYTVRRVERMIANPDPAINTRPEFMRRVAETVHKAYTNGISPESHDALVKSLALLKRDQFREEEEAEAKKPLVTQEDFKNAMFSGLHTPYSSLMDKSIAIAGDQFYEHQGRLMTPLTSYGKYAKLHKLALRRIPQIHRDGWGFRGSHYNKTRLGGKHIITNHFTASGDSEGTISVWNIVSEDHKRVFSHLRNTFKRALKARTPETKLRNIAEYEWWFYQANPANRGAASIGDSMSALMRMSTGLPLEPYAHRDYHALTLP